MIIHRRLLQLSVIAFAVLLGLPAGTAAASAVPNISLLDLAEHNHELRRVEGRAVVLFFTGVGCPIARKSAAKLVELKKRFGKDGVTFWIINTYPEDTVEKEFREMHELHLSGFPYLRDPRQGVALSLGVERTAEVVAISTTDWKVFYQGAIDDQLAEGAERPEPQNRYLKNALTEYLAGQPITEGHTVAHGCRIAFAESGEKDGVPSYAKIVAPIFRQKCAECHREGGVGQWEMDGHGRVKNKARMIEEVLLARRMPPRDENTAHGHFTGNVPLTREEMQALLQWVKAGAPRGDGPDPLKEPMPEVLEWAQGKPDVVLRLPKPEQVPATGVLAYRKIKVSSPLTNETWLAGAEIKPGNRKVVHHAILYGKWPGAPDDGSGNGVFLFGWAPGVPPMHYRDGVGKRLPANAKLMLEMHYTTCGSEQTDQTEVALYFRDGPQPRNAETRAVADHDLDISPGSDEARHTAMYSFPKPATLYSLSPHMHVRGKWMRYELLLPDGTKETLLHVPRYDFNWQHTYALAQPRHVPAGAWIVLTGAFDNSKANPANPDPAQRVRFGLQSWDEMFIGFFEAADDPIAAPTGETVQKSARASAP